MKKLFKFLFLIAILFAGLVSINGWFVMLDVGILHSVFSWPSITISWIQGMQVSIALTSFASFFLKNEYLKGVNKYMK